MPVPAQPKIYHILHVDRLPSIIRDNGLLCDQKMVGRKQTGTTIGMKNIKERRLTELTLDCHPELHVGGCVPFYFCPRSIMLYVIHQANHPELTYHGGQSSIVHLEADLRQTVAWADQNDVRWAFTLSNAGAYYFEDRCDLSQLDEINWNAVQAKRWAGSGISSSVKEGKQAEFLIEQSFPWELVNRIGVFTPVIYQQVATLLSANSHKPRVEVLPGWYY